MRKHHELRVWQQAINLVTRIYAITAEFPADEKFGLTAQLRRAAVSVPSNIAEGAGRAGRNEFLRFLNIARGSLSEVETQLIIGKELGYTQDLTHIETDLEQLFAGLGALIKSMQGD